MDRSKIIEQIRQQSIVARGIALREAAQKSASNVPISAHGASVGGSGKRSSVVSIYLDNDEGLAILVRCNYIGLDENNYPMYTYTIIDGLFSIAINYDNDLSQWKITFFTDGDEPYKLYSYSLISSEWVPEGEPFISVTHTESGTPTSTYWCSSTTDFGYGPIISNLMPAWDGEYTVENPNFWASAVGLYAWIDGNEGIGWFISLDGIGEVSIEGGSQDVLPSSVEIGGVTITATQGSCEL